VSESLTRSRIRLQLGQVATGRFLLVPGDWPVDRAREVLEAIHPKRVVVRSGPGAETTFYLLPLLKAMEVFLGGGPTVDGAVSAARLLPVPALDAALDADDAPD